MFDPKEWTKVTKKINGVKHTVYINEHTGLPKLRATFNRKQQYALDAIEWTTSKPSKFY